MQVSLRTYRELRVSARETLGQVRRDGFTAVCVQGDDEATEILRLTCLEQGIRIQESGTNVPMLRVEGSKFLVLQPEEDLGRL
jgi:hypothetical protein